MECGSSFIQALDRVVLGDLVVGQEPLSRSTARLHLDRRELEINELGQVTEDVVYQAHRNFAGLPSSALLVPSVFRLNRRSSRVLGIFHYGRFDLSGKAG